MGYNLFLNGIYIEVITHLRTIDPNFQRDIQVVAEWVGKVGVGGESADWDLEVVPIRSHIQEFISLVNVNLKILSTVFFGEP